MKIERCLRTMGGFYRVLKKFKNFLSGTLNACLKRHRCKICGSKQLQVIYVDWARYILKCHRCDTHFAIGLKSMYNMDEAYNSQRYWLTRRVEVSGSRKNNEDSWKDWQDWKRQIFERLKLEEFEKEIATPRKALEIGCGEGKVLEILRDRGWDVLGLDISDYIVRSCQKAGLKVIAGSIEETVFPDSSFDLVIMFHVVEHLRDPLFALKRVFKILKNNGQLIIEVPFLKDKRDFLLDSKDLYHLFFFTGESLQKMLDIAGFTYVDKLIYDDVFNQPRRNVCYMFRK